VGSTMTNDESGSIHQVDGCAVCSPTGELDAATVSQFREAIAEISCEPRVVIDLTAVTFIDSAGLGALIGTVRRVHENGGTMTVACPRPSLTRLLEAVGFDSVVPVRNTVGAAVSATTQQQ